MEVVISNILDKLIPCISNFFYPNAACAICEKELMANENGLYCNNCKPKPLIEFENLCSHCSIPIEKNDVAYSPYGYKCKRCQESFSYYKKHISYTLYKDSVTKALYKLKYGGSTFFAKDFANSIAMHFPKEKMKVDIVVAVPVHVLRRLIRGYNQAELIARHFCDITGLDFVDALVRKKMTKKLSGLGREDRTRELKNAIIIRHGLDKIVKGKNILIIDDIFTTGTTLENSAKALYEAGACEIFCMTYAMGRRENATN